MQTETNRPRQARRIIIMLAALLIVAIGASMLGTGALTSTPTPSSGKVGIQPQAPGASVASSANVQTDSNVPSQVLGSAKVVKASYADTSPALRDIPPAADIPRASENENPLPYKPANQGIVDPVVQTFFGPLAMPTPIVNFAGIPNLCGCLPPDVNADVSANYVVETVNAKLQVWDKTGTSLLGPVNINTLFAGTGTACATHNDGDPVVLHDQMADRWLVTQFTSSAPFGQCLAVSTTADPTGSYHRYFFAQGTLLNDYPHYGIWPDAYLFTANRFAGNAFDSPVIGAFDRVKMLAGDPSATYQEINPGNFFYAILPADLDGSTLPPAGAPSIFASVSGTVATMRTWRYHVDFATPGNTTLTGPINVPIAPYDGDMCGGARSCIPQLGTTAKLDAIAGRIMHRVAYRNMGGYQNIVASGTVDVNGADLAGIRWYEVRDPLGVPTVFQQGTYSPDNTHRWMPSIAMDRDGNIAVEYSASSATINPQIRYAGRLAGDPLGQLAQGEATLFAGTGSQTSTTGRWGDYTSLTVDPSDDCTFWAASEYYIANGGNWQTRLGSFKFPGCGSTTPTPTVTGTPPTATATPSSTATVTPVPTVCRSYGYTTATDTITVGITNDTGLHCDDCGSLTDLPFPVKFYNQTFSSIAFSSNGVLQFGSTDYSFGNECLPVPVADYAIYAWWDDLVTNVANTGIYTSVTGSAPSRVYHVEFKAQSLSDNLLVDAEVRLHEDTSNFEIVYGPTTSSSQYATIGTQALYSSGTFTQVSCNTAGITTGTRLNFTIASCPPQPTNTPTTVPPTGTSTSTAIVTATSTQTPGTPGSATATPTACTIQFADVLPGNTFYANIRCLACRGIINGYPCGGDNEPCNSTNDPYFRPSNNISRGQLAKVVSLSAGFNEPVTGQTFEDVAPGTTFYDYVERLASRGVMGGYPCGVNPNEPCGPGNLPYFRPGANATRGQLTKIVSNAAGFTDPDPSTFTFTDVPPGSTFHLYVERLLINRPGVMNGYPCSAPAEPCDDMNRPYFRPSNTLTRGQASKIIANTFFPSCQTPGK
ncbi:MAG: S-layer homology domain-containing protein [Chloroflexia bacterium]